jgi:hypothetical protein
MLHRSKNQSRWFFVRVSPAMQPAAIGGAAEGAGAVFAHSLLSR